jgi:short subunit dehydrogenase-like uncharacterized protein
MRPVLAGRSGEEVGAQARELGLEHRVFPLSDAREVARALEGFTAVLHCAGPFVHTWRPMAEACLASGAHYLDITGEIEVFEGLAALDREAERAGVMLLPGVGFDVVPTDCLAAHLVRRLPGAQLLLLGLRSGGRMSRGTANTFIEHAHGGSAVRRGGRIVRVPAGWKTREIDFGSGPRTAVSIPWGDVSTAYHSTGIGDIEVYSAVSRSMRLGMRAARGLGWLLARPSVKRLLRAWVARRPPGATDEELARGSTVVWGLMEDGAGARVVSRIRGPDGYVFTYRAALEIAGRVLDGEARPGFQTPSKMFGPDWVLELDGVEREDVEAE